MKVTFMFLIHSFDLISSDRIDVIYAIHHLYSTLNPKSIDMVVLSAVALNSLFLGYGSEPY